jgi:tRNA A-37 threonylcarbamoyl transferase component Bud32
VSPVTAAPPSETGGDGVTEAKHIPRPGDVLAGKYEVEHVLGQGGMGVVVAARHKQLDQRVALKFLLPEAMAHAQVVERFAREARAAARIKGEHVARVIDVGEMDGGIPYMVLEYLEGRDLAATLSASGPLPVTDAVRYVLETCEALAEAHAAGIVHRDLKPANLFIAKHPGQRDIVKVLDFGISKMIEPANQALTQTATVLGTAFYMSPEQLTNPKGVDARSDVWALGVILYELTTGLVPFGGETVPEVIASILRNVPEAPSVHVPDYPPALEKSILRCLKTDREQRFANVAELAHALAPLADVRDRVSVEMIGRVLGVTIVDGPDPPAAVDGAGPTFRPPAAKTAVLTAIPTTTAAPVAPTSEKASPAVATSLALTNTPPTHETQKKRVGTWIFAAVGLVALGGGGAVVVATAPPSGGGVRAADPTPDPAASTSASVIAPASAPPAVETPPSAAVAPPSTAAPSASTDATSLAPAPPSHAPTHKAPPRPAAAALVKSASAAPTAAPAPSAAPAPTPSKNPLKVELK